MTKSLVSQVIIIKRTELERKTSMTNRINPFQFSSKLINYRTPFPTLSHMHRQQIWRSRHSFVACLCTQNGGKAPVHGSKGRTVRSCKCLARDSLLFLHWRDHAWVFRRAQNLCGQKEREPNWNSRKKLRPWTPFVSQPENRYNTMYASRLFHS